MCLQNLPGCKSFPKFFVQLHIHKTKPLSWPQNFGLSEKISFGYHRNSYYFTTTINGNFSNLEKKNTLSIGDYTMHAINAKSVQVSIQRISVMLYKKT